MTSVTSIQLFSMIFHTIWVGCKDILEWYSMLGKI
jgi:hypothetical protein